MVDRHQKFKKFQHSMNVMELLLTSFILVVYI